MRKLIASIILISICFLCVTCKTSLGGYSKLKLAEELVRQQKYDEAIQAYKDHIADRLARKDRPEWENPNFYYLFIGDIQLHRDKLNEALEAYAHSEKEGIDSSFISDRYLYTAKWLENKGKLDEARELLKTHRSLDPLMFDSNLDRISKKIIQQQDAQTPVPQN